MYAQLAMALLQGYQDQNKKMQKAQSDTASQQYAPWTGQKVDFSPPASKGGMSNLLSGFGGGMLQDQVNNQAAADKTADVLEQRQAANQDDANYYSQLSNNPNSVGVSPQPTGGFGASQGLQKGNASAFSGQSNPWASYLGGMA